MTPIIIAKRQGKDRLERIEIVHNFFAGKKSRSELYSVNITKILILSLLLLLVFICTSSTGSQIATENLPRCACKNASLYVQDLWLGNATGHKLSSCTLQAPAEAYIWVKIRNLVDSSINSVILLTDIYVNNTLRYSTYPRGLLISKSIPGKANITISIYSFPYSCGDSVKLSRFGTSSETDEWLTYNNADINSPNQITCDNRELNCSAEIACNCADINCSNTGTRYYGEDSTEVTVSGPPPCSITGPNTICELKDAIYSAAVEEIPGYTYSYTWSIDGSEKGTGKSLLIDASSYSLDYHEIKLRVNASQGNQVVSQSDCSIRLLIIKAPPTGITVT
jgi:hypothetical protein